MACCQVLHVTVMCYKHTVTVYYTVRQVSLNFPDKIINKAVHTNALQYVFIYTRPYLHKMKKETDNSGDICLILFHFKVVYEKTLYSLQPCHYLCYCAICHLFQVNTLCVESLTSGINHVEGGWPKNIDPLNIDETDRHKKKALKDEHCVSSMRSLVSVSV